MQCVVVLLIERRGEALASLVVVTMLGVERVRGNPIVNEEKREHREPPSNLGGREERAGLRERRKSIPSWELEEGRKEWKGQL